MMLAYPSASCHERTLLECLADRNADAPQWKLRIEASVSEAIKRVQGPDASK